MENYFQGKIINLFGNKKHDGGSSGGRRTGEALLANTTNYVIVDFDINKKLDGGQRRQIYDELMEALKDLKVRLVRTCNKGLHVYTMFDGNEADYDKNRYVKAYSNEKYEIDVFVGPVQKEKRSLIVLPESECKDMNGFVTKYVEVKMCHDQHLMPFSELCNALRERLNIEFTFKKSRSYTPIVPKVKQTSGLSEIVTELELLCEANPIQGDTEETSVPTEEEDKKWEEELAQRRREMEEEVNKRTFEENLAIGFGIFLDDSTCQGKSITTFNELNEQIFDVIIEGLLSVEIHNDSANISIEREVTLLPLFQAFNDCFNYLDGEVVGAGIEKILDNGWLTSNAKANFELKYQRCGDSAQPYQLLYKILKIHNNEYFKSKVIPLVMKRVEFDDGDNMCTVVADAEHDVQTVEIKNEKGEIIRTEQVLVKKTPSINIKDKFTLETIERNAKKGKYIKTEVVTISSTDKKGRTLTEDIETTEVNYDELMPDLMKVLVVIRTAPLIYCIKISDDSPLRLGKNKIIHVKQKQARELLETIKLGKIKTGNVGKPRTATIWSVINESCAIDSLKKNGILFYTEHKKYLSIFQGYDYTLLPETDYNVIELFMNHWREVIAAGNEEVFKYSVNWVARVLQNPSIKNETVLCLTGCEGAGKNIFTNTISDLFGVYANPNVCRFDDIVGQFNTVIENKKLIVVNELQSVDTGKPVNFDTLKSVITDKTININRKGHDLREVENVANFIFVTNNLVPVKITANDRRYMIQQVSNSRIGDFNYFHRLDSARHNKKFMNNLFSYLMKLDVSKYNPREIPETEAREQVIEANITPIELFIKKHKNLLLEGVVPDNCYNMYLTFCDEEHIKDDFRKSKRKFFTAIGVYCELVQVRKHEKRIRVYRLKDEYIRKIKSDEDEIDPDAFCEDDIPVKQNI